MRRFLPLACLVATSAVAQVAPGDSLPLPDRALASVAGETSALGTALGPQGLVVLFWSNPCPWGDRYAGRVASLAREYGAAGVRLVLVNSNAPNVLEAESAEAGRAELAAAGLSVPYLLDADGALAEAFGVRRAPHAFFFGADGRLLYDGAIDDSPSSAERVERAYLREALDQAIADLPVAIQKTQPFGCRVRRDVAPPPPPDTPPPTPPAP